MLPNPRREADVIASPASRRDARYAFCAAALVAVLAVSGCAGRKTHVIPWGTAMHVRPRLLEKTAPPEVPEPSPDLRLIFPDPPWRTLGARSLPPRPHAAVVPGASDSRSDAPTIVPQLSQEESAAAQRQTQENLAIAQRNLSAARGSSQAAAQADLAEKIRSFIADASEAAREGDWVRARNLAQKAQVLSEGLARPR